MRKNFSLLGRGEEKGIALPFREVKSETVTKKEENVMPG